MTSAIRISSDHVEGGFKWVKKPDCCQQLKNAFEERFIFVASMVDGEEPNDYNLVYIMPLDDTGEPVRKKGIAISHCPWCGTGISVRKKI
ncbi:hypothetical protein ASD74_13170 [Rhizobium sp. Root564]|uniref:hypothetical protein n=1 Tax=Agrobacterium cavarae TaxID=2528239 RepID=UPI000715C60F|nr:hypothetical protein [Agrobacterium cavarae]KQZ95739.1 hypothetical protein ASD74_13170 [Rhizobium sp. Root564]